MDDAQEPGGATEAIAQSRAGGGRPLVGGDPSAAPQPGEGRDYDISERLTLVRATQLYERRDDEPLYRRLPVFTLDASARKAEGRTTELKVPYEPLSDGVRGRVMAVEPTAPGSASLRRAQLDHPHVLIAGGYPPSISDPRFHQQMVYAVAMQCYGQFQTALGRQPSWAFDRREEDVNRLTLRPFGAPDTAQAWYDRDEGAVVFGYFEPRQATPSVPNRKGSYVFLSLSHDVIVHEVTHAILDGLRPDFFVPSHPDVAAFHEAFADLIAAFQRFSLEEAVKAALDNARGDLTQAGTLIEIGREFGRAIHPEQKALRTLLGNGDMLRQQGYARAPDEPHDRGEYLTCAVFCAFAEVYRRRSQKIIRLATGGSGLLPDGAINPLLTDALVHEVRRVALQFLSICIRAIDYCPPVDIRFGDYLRALVTADRDLVPDDDLGYREALIHSFGAHGIFGEGTPFMSEDALVWNGPTTRIEPIAEVSFGTIRFEGDPARPTKLAELRRQAGAIGRRVAEPALAKECGLLPVGDTRFGRDRYARPVVTSVRSARRVGPDGQVTFDTVAEVIQTRWVERKGRLFQFYGGATLILGPRGELRYVIRKRVDHPDRPEEMAAYAAGAGAPFWRAENRHLTPRPDAFRRLCFAGASP